MLKFQYYKLLRSPEGAKKVSLGFAIGFGLEMLVIYTASLVYVIFYPIVRLVGIFSCCGYWQYYWKISFLPVVLFPLAYALGKMIYPFHVQKYIMNHLRYQTCFQVTFYDIKELITE